MPGRRSFRSSRAFLVRAADIGETDRRLTFFTEAAGLAAVVAKAARRSRKRFGGGLQKYLLLEVTWTEDPGRMGVLTSAVIRESFWEIAAAWEKVRYADHLLEICASLFPQPGPKPKVFAFVLAGFRSLSAGERPVSVARKLEAVFLALGGWGPDLSGCRSCGREESRTFRFIVSEARLLCEDCAGQRGARLSQGAVRTWRALQMASPATVGRIRVSDMILDEFQYVIPEYLEWNLGRPLRSLGADPAAGNR